LKKPRPTTGIVLQALFNILGPVSGRSFLDLFTGTGRVACEAAERGFSPVAGVDRSGAALRGFEKKGEPPFEMIRGDVRGVVPALHRSGRRFDVVFADPPYLLGWPPRLESMAESLSGIIESGGVLVLEHSRRETFTPDPNLFSSGDTRMYGESCLSFFDRLDTPRSEGGL